MPVRAEALSAFVSRSSKAKTRGRERLEAKLSSKVSEPLLLVEPRGHPTRAFARIKAERLRSQPAIRTALNRYQRHARYGRHAVWIVPSASAMQLLLGTLPRRPVGDQRLLSLEGADGDRHGLLQVLFRFVVSVDDGVRLSPTDELAQILGSADRADLLIGAALARADDAVILYRGNLEPLVVPLRRQLETDRSLGGALRRLRLQKGLRQSDFPGLTAKEIARIERGEVKKPQQRTLAAIAKRIGVAAKEISTY